MLDHRGRSACAVSASQNTASSVFRRLRRTWNARVLRRAHSKYGANAERPNSRYSATLKQRRQIAPYDRAFGTKYIKLYHSLLFLKRESFNLRISVYGIK